MAIQKEVELPSGISPEYHRVEEIKISALDKSGSTCVKLYLNTAARESGKKEIRVKEYKLPAGTFSSLDLSSEDARVIVYLYLKTLTEFTGARDV